MAYAVGDRVLIKVDQDGGQPTYVSGTVSTVSDETPYGVTIDGDDVESTWYVDSELSPAPADADPAEEPDTTAVAAARRGTRAITRQPAARDLQAAERKRVGSIMNSDEAKGREALANHFAFETSMSADEAKAALAKSPKQEPVKSAAAANRFEAAMSTAGNPNVGPDTSGSGGEADDGVAFADRYFASKRQQRSA